MESHKIHVPNHQPVNHMLWNNFEKIMAFKAGDFPTEMHLKKTFGGGIGAIDIQLNFPEVKLHH